MPILSTQTTASALSSAHTSVKLSKSISVYNPQQKISFIKKNSNKKIKNQQKYIRSTIDTQIMSASPVCRYS